MSACTRGVSTRYGTAITAATTSTTSAATAPISHFTARLTTSSCSGALNGREPPRIRPDRPGKRPVLLELLRRLVPRDDGAGGVVDRVVHERAREVDRDEVLTRLLPGLRDLSPANVHRLHAVGLARRAQLVALRRELAVHPRGQLRAHRAHVARDHRALPVAEATARGIGHESRVERGIQRANVAEATVEIARHLGDGILHAGGGIRAATRIAAGVGRARSRVRRLGLAARRHEAEEQKHTGADQQQLEEPDAAAEAAAEQQTAEEPAEREAGEASHDSAEPAARGL